MTDQSQNIPPISIDERITIDQICVQFEQALRTNETPSIEQHLSQVPEDLHSLLLEELLHLELSYRHEQQQTSEISDYLNRFSSVSEQNNIIHRVWQQIMADSDAVATPAFGLQIPGFTILERIARGGMGVVYKACDEKLNRTVAIKMLTGDTLASEQIQRFHLEARAISISQHPNIVQIYSIARHFDQPYFVLEYTDGGTLSARLKQQNNLYSPTEAAELMQLLAETLQHIHDQGFLHRDLKPSNILFDGKGIAKISDFGLAKDMSTDGLTRSEHILGTPAYMAPEQARNDKDQLGPWTDVYGLGSILYQLLSGKAPYAELSASQAIAESLNDEPISTAALDDVPAPLAAICLKCLHKNPQQRYQSAKALADDLQRFVQGDSISSQSRKSKQSKKFWSAGVAIAIGIAALLTLTYWHLFPATTEPQNAIAQQLQNAEAFVPGQTYHAVTLLDNLAYPKGLAVNQQGNGHIAIADTLHQKILLIDGNSGEVVPLAGTGEVGYSGDQGPADVATLNYPSALIFDENGDLLLAGRGNHAIRKVSFSANNTITTVAGGLGCGNAPSDGWSAVESPLCLPHGLALAGEHGWFIIDNINRRIRHINNKNIASSIISPKILSKLDVELDLRQLRQLLWDQRRRRLYFINAQQRGIQYLQIDAEITNANPGTLVDGLIAPTSMALTQEGTLLIADPGQNAVLQVQPEAGAKAEKIDLAMHKPLHLAVTPRNQILISDAQRLHILRAGAGPAPVALVKPKLQQIFGKVFDNVPYKQVLSELAMHGGLEYDSNLPSDLLGELTRLPVADFRIIDIIDFYAFFDNTNYAITEHTLYFAEEGRLSELTDAPETRLRDSYSGISNHQDLPDYLRQEAEREIAVDYQKNSFIEIVQDLGQRSQFDYRLDSSMDILRQSEMTFSGKHAIGDFHYVLNRLAGIQFTYQDGKIKVRFAPQKK